MGGAFGSAPAARAVDHHPISVFQGRWRGGNVSFRGGSAVKPSREVMSRLHQGPHLLTPGSPVPTAGLKDPETQRFGDNTTLIRGRGQGQLWSEHYHNRPPHVPMSALSYWVSRVPQPTPFLSVLVDKAPSFTSERFEINLLLLRDSGLTVDPKCLSQKTACLFLQSGFSPRQPRQPSKYCLFWTLSCWTSNGSACSHSTLVVGREGATQQGCGHLGWDVHVVSVHWCVFEEKWSVCFCLFTPWLADSHPTWSAPRAGVWSLSFSNSPAQPCPGYLTPTCPRGQRRPVWLGARSEAAGAASVGGASRALGTAAGTLAGRVQPERCHIPAPL